MKSSYKDIGKFLKPRFVSEFGLYNFMGRVTTKSQSIEKFYNPIFFIHHDIKMCCETTKK